MFTIKVFVEILVILAIAYGIWHEEELIELEDVLIQFARRGFKKGRGSKPIPEEILQMCDEYCAEFRGGSHNG